MFIFQNYLMDTIVFLIFKGTQKYEIFAKKQGYFCKID